MTTESRRIFLIDDDESLLAALGMHLSALGFDVEEMNGGESALDVLEFEQPDAIVLDINMPGMTGVETLREIRQRHGAGIPVIILTGHADSDSVAQLLEMGATDVVTKPAIPLLLAHRLKFALSPAHGRGKEQDSGPVAFTTFAMTVSDRYCPNCVTSTVASATSCAECGAPRPQTGWAHVVGSTYPYLGTPIGERLLADRFLGGGANGTVYRALDRTFKRHVAVKVVKVPPDTDDSGKMIRQQLKQEILATAKVNSAHAVRFFDAIPLDPSTIALVMDLVMGRTVSDALTERGRLAVEDALSVTLQTAYALHAAHACGLIHRDVKPDNILIEPLPGGGWFARIVDFGVVHVLGVAQAPERRGLFFGTPTYAAPEQVSKDAVVDQRTDVYQLACVLHHMIGGAPPFDSESPATVLRAHLYQQRPALPANLFASSKVADAVNRLLDKAMDKMPARRHQTMEAFIHDIKECERRAVHAAAAWRSNPHAPTDTLDGDEEIDTMLMDYLKEL